MTLSTQTPADVRRHGSHAREGPAGREGLAHHAPLDLEKPSPEGTAQRPPCLCKKAMKEEDELTWKWPFPHACAFARRVRAAPLYSAGVVTH